jgi:hypothetical protein
VAKVQEDQFADLDKKLMEVEQSRKEVIRRDHQDRQEARQRKAEIAQNMQTCRGLLRPFKWMNSKSRIVVLLGVGANL